VEWWPIDVEAMIALQARLAAEADTARRDDPAVLVDRPLLGGCFVAFARGEAGPGQPGDHAWAAGVTWRPIDGPRDEGAALRGTSHEHGPRVAHDTHEQAVVSGTVPASYEPGLLAMREGAILERAVRALATPPDLLLVDASGLDHPRRAGLAIHLGRVLGVPTVGVTHRQLHARDAPEPSGTARGERSPMVVDGELVAYWVVTRAGARPLVAHAGWRTTAAQAADVVLLASTPSSRTPVPLGEARRVAREARAIACGEWA
jgi:deoxyribonuclease V